MHKFREVVAVSAKRMTDRQKKKIVADYVQLQNYARAAKLNDVAESTVRKIVKDNPKCADLCALKKEQNTQDMLSYLGSKRGEAQDLLGLYLQAMADHDKIAEATLPQLSTAFGTIVLHVAPEAAIGGPLALVKTGDRISLDVPNRSPRRVRGLRRREPESAGPGGSVLGSLGFSPRCTQAQSSAS